MKPSNQTAATTRDHLLNVGEALFISHGFDKVSAREIVRQAGQKNESVLQYHFKGRDGLLDAIQERRSAQLEEKRAQIVDEFLIADPSPDLRAVCALLIRAPIALCREDKTFRAFLGVFGQRLIASGQQVTTTLAMRRGASLVKIHNMLHASASHLDEELFVMRFEALASLVLLSLSRRAREGGSFRGKGAALFMNNLADLMAAMLAAPVSSDTQACLENL